MKRVFLIVLDSFGVGEMPDANEYPAFLFQYGNTECSEYAKTRSVQH